MEQEENDLQFCILYSVLSIELTMGNLILSMHCK